ncbi:hypothetical protein SSP531S_24780 [Streptomyces spongiicola]|uniref:Uncharacterized protein n=1 Tax=Streptomyces spongiicola TaxID=1690221 RepID=A0A388SWM6_9ACTN|nr:hypothetical protein SSP531S_24780 [Streptomyces spongiicola]
MPHSVPGLVRAARIRGNDQAGGGPARNRSTCAGRGADRMRCGSGPVSDPYWARCRTGPGAALGPEPVGYRCTVDPSADADADGPSHTRGLDSASGDA